MASELAMNAWDTRKREIKRSLHVLLGFNDLKALATRIMGAIDQGYLDLIIQGMPRRINTLVSVRGDTTLYLSRIKSRDSVFYHHVPGCIIVTTYMYV